jgi:hypothetical protein
MTPDVVLGSDPGISARALASRKNGARSRGPRTAAGKARSSRNALKHGLCAKKILVLPEEDAGQFRALEAVLLKELAPVGALQAVLAERVVSAAWRLMRADRLEAEVLAFRCAPNGDLGLALMRDGNGTRSFDTVMRYRGAATAELMRALKTLQALQAEARAEAGLPAAPVKQRRAPTTLARRNEPEPPRRINGSIANRATAARQHALDQKPEAEPGTLASARKAGAPKPGADLRLPRRSPDLDGPDAAPMPLASPRTATKRTRESASNQRLGPRAHQPSAARGAVAPLP